jgi:hypothetical protein
MHPDAQPGAPAAVLSAAVGERPLTPEERTALTKIDFASKIIGLLCGIFAAGFGLAALDGGIPSDDSIRLGLMLAAAIVAFAAGTSAYRMRGIARSVVAQGIVLELRGPAAVSRPEGPKADVTLSVGGASFRLAASDAAKIPLGPETRIAFVAGLPAKPLGGRDAILLSVNGKALPRAAAVNVERLPAGVVAQ